MNKERRMMNEELRSDLTMKLLKPDLQEVSVS